MWTKACSLRPRMYGSASGSSSSAWSKAWPMPATLPCPKIPKQPAKSLCSSPSDSEYWALRNLTSACATVRRTFSDISSLLDGLGKESRVDGLSLPGIANPRLVGMVGDLPGPLGTWTGHYVQVVHVEPRRRDAGPMPAMRNQHRVSIMNLFQ